MQSAVIPDDWEEQYCLYSICWPKSPQWEAVLRGVLSIPQTGRFWNEATGTVTEAQNIVEKTFDHNFQLVEVLMQCDTGTTQALLAIAAALSNSGIGGGGGSNGCTCVSFTNRGSNVQVQTVIELTDGSNWPIFSSGPLPTLPETGFPDGYSDLGAYDADKCAKATKIVTDLIATLTNMAALNIGVGAIGALLILGCLVGLIVVPEATIPLLLFAMVGNVGVTTALGLLANYINDNKLDFICILYQNDNLETMVNLLSDALDVAIAAIAVEGAVAVAIKSIALWLTNGDTLGVLLTTGAKDIFPTADCLDCTCPRFSENALGTEGHITAVDGWSVTIEAGFDHTGRYDADVLVYMDTGGVACGPLVRLTDLGDFSPVAGDYSGAYHLYDENSTPTYTSDTPPSLPANAQRVVLTSGEPFTVTLTFELIP